MTLIKADDGRIITDWHRKTISSGRVLIFLANHSVQNKIGVVKNLINRALKLPHPIFNEKNIEYSKRTLFLNYCPFDLSKKLYLDRVNHIKRKNNNQNKNNIEECNKLYTVVLPYFGKISNILKTILGHYGLHTIYRAPFKSYMIVKLEKER